MYQDLREFIGLVDAAGGLRRVTGVDARFELGAVAEVAADLQERPALLFDGIQGYPRGYRVFCNATLSPSHAALALGIDPALPPMEALKAWREKRKSMQPIRPTTVSDAAFLARSVEGEEVDLGRLPVPIWHRTDGGPYIGTGAMVVTADPDGDWVNAAIYRVQVHDRNLVTVQFDHEGRHGSIIAHKFWSQGRSCPIAIVVGQDPALFVAGFEALPEQKSEYEFAGGLKGSPIELVAGPLTGLPIPARAEIVLEGQLLPPSEATLMEGPFGEFTGYAAGQRPAAVMRVDALHHRDDPILFGAPPLKPPRFLFGLPLRAGSIWKDLDACGIPDVTGVWQHVSQLMTVVAVRQRYPGHAKRAGLVAAAGAYLSRVVVVVDDDVDAADLNDVMWAISTRCEPCENVDIIRNGWSSALDPRLHPAAREAGETAHSKMIIEACRPYAWRAEFPTPTVLSPREFSETASKWRHMLVASTPAC